MSLSDMMGIKTLYFELKNQYTIDEFYEKIKDADFGNAGKPGVYTYMSYRVIAFPPIDAENQVWIMTQTMGKNKGKLCVMRSTAIATDAGVAGALAAGLAADKMSELSGGITELRSGFGKPKKKCMADVDTVYEVVNRLGL